MEPVGSPGFHQAGVGEDPEMVAHQRLGDALGVHQVAHAALLLSEGQEDAQPGLVGQRSGDLEHRDGALLGADRASRHAVTVPADRRIRQEQPADKGGELRAQSWAVYEAVYAVGVRRTNIYLSEIEQAALDARAAAEGSTRSEVLRAIVDRELNLGPEADVVDAALAELAAELAARARALSATDPDLAID